MRRPSLWSSPLFWALVGAVIVAVVPWSGINNYKLSVLSFVAIHTILAVGLNLLMGYAGQVSLGHAAFFGIGAYTSAILTTQCHVSPWLALPIGIALTCLVAYLVGVPCLRLRGHYLAMATLGFGWIIYIVMVHWTALTGGTSGIESIPKLNVGAFVFDTDVRRFYLIWGVTLAVLVIAANVVNSRVGRALRALHGSESAASALGIDLAKYKVQVFMLSAAFAAIAGFLYAHTVNFISPSVFGFVFSVELVVMVVIGGMASVWGALIGATTITLLVEWLRGLGQAIPAFKEFDVIAHGLILMLVIIFMPLGLTAGVRDLILKAFRRRSPASRTASTPEEVAK